MRRKRQSIVDRVVAHEIKQEELRSETWLRQNAERGKPGKNSNSMFEGLFR
jgi:hypothetical protein